MHLKSFRLYPISRGSLAPAGLLFYLFADVGKMENRAEENPLPGHFYITPKSLSI